MVLSVVLVRFCLLMFGTHSVLLLSANQSLRFKHLEVELRCASLIGVCDVSELQPNISEESFRTDPTVLTHLLRTAVFFLAVQQ